LRQLTGEGKAVAKQALKGILAAIGNTPLIALDRLMPASPMRVFAKMERFNPGGSVKDRPALSMLLDKVRSGELVPGRSVVIESSSGNLAIGLAQACQYFGLRLICVVDAKTTEQNLAILRAYQASVEVVTDPDPETGEFLPVRVGRVRDLVASTPHAFWPNQYSNPLNSQAHKQTMHEIVEALDGSVDYLFCAASSCGTLGGCAQYVRQAGLATKIIAVDAVGSAIFGGQTPGLRLIPGHGASLRPGLFDPHAASDVVHVTDLECVVGCRRLTIREAILGGGSSGAAVAALERYSKHIPAGSNCVLIFPDGGDRYLNTIYSDDWVRGNFGDISHLWKEENADPST
jgi:2,3-diaminopropionate biosynthesis protein SbnA